MRGRDRTTAVGGWRSCLIAVVSMLAASTPVWAQNQPPHEGANIGVVIPAITHGEMLVVAKYRARILDLAATIDGRFLRGNRQGGWRKAPKRAALRGERRGAIGDWKDQGSDVRTPVNFVL